jgi:hypothetical protein
MQVQELEAIIDRGNGNGTVFDTTNDSEAPS